MAFSLEDYMESKGFSESQRALLREQANHSVSLYGLNGEHITTAFEKEDLLALISGMERYLVDSNVAWQKEAAKPANRNKAFIIGRTIDEETDNLRSVFFNADISNNNLFAFSMDNRRTKPFLQIDRFDGYYVKVFDDEKLRLESRPRKDRTDEEFLEQESHHMAMVLQMKQVILTILRFPDLLNLPPVHATERTKGEIIQLIRSKAPYCFKNYFNSAEVASNCYAALLLERDAVGEKTRHEFNNTQRRNVFGDTTLIQNALWFNSRVFSNDNAVRRMVDYIKLPEVNVVGCL